MTDFDQRLERLETRVEFQEETINQLNDVVVALNQRLTATEKTQEALIKKLQTLTQEPEMLDPDKEPPPPHY